ncbi:HNH endonuclease signature motif containing protein [Micromonospora sp. CPCC 206060]|uniref:HNH endonuclease n=1 Tax=Micromonospora sp. CPCC 206060 TaxID=3122406 RepID=UPI002FF20C34
MVRYRYTPEMLRAAVAASTSVADVLRYFQLAPSGGSHAHLRRRIAELGIDTSHFSARPRGAGPRRRLAAAEILVLGDPLRRRARPELLRRALIEHGMQHRCASCHLGPSWNGQRLTLHVDHISGESWDCRPGNLRLLCPNCHSQTATYAGRNRRRLGVVTGTVDGSGSDPASLDGRERRRQAVPETELVEVLRRVDRQELTADAAARLVGCHPAHLHRIRSRLTEAGVLDPRPGGRRWRAATRRDTVIRYALAHPELGPKTIARRLRELPGGCLVSHGTVSNILRAAGLNTVAARRSRLVRSAGVA